MISNLLADIRYSARGVGARPGFVAVVMLTLALGIGARWPRPPPCSPP